MIYESVYWKDDLLKHASMLRKKMDQKRWSESSTANVEKHIMIGFYIIRKLIEASKLSDETIKSEIMVKAYPWNGEHVNRINFHDFELHYDMRNEIQEKLILTYLCNQIVHSHVFTIVTGEEKGLAGIFFNSDQKKNKILYYIDSANIIDIFEKIGRDYPNRTRSVYNEKTKEWEFHAEIIIN